MNFKVFLTEDRARIEWLRDYYIKGWAKVYYKSEAEMRAYMKAHPVLGHDGTSWDGQFNQILETDPTDKKVYTKWLIDRFFGPGNDRFHEDVDAIHDALKTYDRIKARLPATWHDINHDVDKVSADINPKDINQIKKYHQLFRLVFQFSDTKSNREVKRDDVARFKSQIITLYSGSDGDLYIPTTEEASKFLGRGTKWCTAADRNNMFHDYSEIAPLFVYQLKTGMKVQYHGLDFVDQWDTFGVGMTSEIEDGLLGFTSADEFEKMQWQNSKLHTATIQTVNNWIYQTQLCDETDTNRIRMWAGLWFHKPGFERLYTTEYGIYFLGLALHARSKLGVSAILDQYVKKYPTYSKAGMLVVLRQVFNWL